MEDKKRCYLCGQEGLETEEPTAPYRHADGRQWCKDHKGCNKRSIENYEEAWLLTDCAPRA